MKFSKMLNDRVHLRLLDAPERTPGGKLFIPESAQQTRQRAEVLCAGPEAHGIEVGMIIELETYAGTVVDDDEVVCRAGNLVGVWEGE